jgi:hypothetical protein
MPTANVHVQISINYSLLSGHFNHPLINIRLHPWLTIRYVNVIRSTLVGIWPPIQAIYHVMFTMQSSRIYFP